MLAIYKALKYLRLYFRLAIDYQNESQIVNLCLQTKIRQSFATTGTIDFISQFTMEIIHISGKDNSVADALSRIAAVNVPVLLNTEEIAAESQKDEDLPHILEGRKDIVMFATFQSHWIE